MLILVSLAVDDNFQCCIDALHPSDGPMQQIGWSKCSECVITWTYPLVFVMMVLSSVSSSSTKTSLITDSLMQKLCSYANELTVATLLCVDVCQGIGITKMLHHSEPTQKLTKLEFKVVNDQNSNYPCSFVLELHRNIEKQCSHVRNCWYRHYYQTIQTCACHHLSSSNLYQNRYITYFL